MGSRGAPGKRRHPVEPVLKEVAMTLKGVMRTGESGRT